MTEEGKMTKAPEEVAGLSGIFLAEYQMSNMRMERIVVSNPAILKILELPQQLSQEAQEKIVNDLVDRTPEWQEMDQAAQVEKIKTVLTQETVLEHLVYTGTIRKDCQMTSIGIDKEGSIVIEAYYTTMNRKQRRMVEKVVSDAEKEKMRREVNILGRDDNLIDLAREKMARMEKKKGQ